MSEDRQHDRSLARVPADGSAGGISPQDMLQDLSAVGGGEAGTELPSNQRPFSPRQLLRYKWSILFVFFMTATIAVGGIWTAIIPRYKAIAMIEISPSIPKLAGPSDTMPFYENFRGTQADYVKNPSVLNATLDDPKVQQTRWYQGAPASPLERLREGFHLREILPPLDRLRDALVVEVPKSRQALYVTMTATTPGEAKLIVDKVLENYIAFTKERATTSDDAHMNALQNQIADRVADLRRLEDDAARIRLKLNTTAPVDVARERSLHLLDLETRISTIETEIRIKTRRLEDMREEGPASSTQPATDEISSESVSTEGNTATPTTETAGSQPAWTGKYILNPRWQLLNDRFIATEREIRSREGRYGDQDERLAALRRTLKDTEAERQMLEAQLDQASGISREDLSSPAALEKSIHDQQIELEGLKKQLDQEQGIARDYLSDTEELTRLDAKHGRIMIEYQRLQSSLNEMQMNREVAGSVQKFAADEPATPDNDKRLKLTMAALLGAFGLGVALAFLRIKLSPTVDQVVEIAQPARNAFLGHMPLLHKPAEEPLEQCPPQLESVRMIRTALLNRLNGAHGVVVQITSATLGSGKSTLANALARSLAQGGKSVLLVDADLRRPTLAKRFSIEPVPGLRDVLANPNSETASIRTTDTRGLSVLPAGTSAGHTERELLANGLFSGLLHKWRERYDLVLLDGAPLLGPADAAILAGGVDGTILVVRERHCRREAVLEALAVLGAAGGRLFGTVFVGSGGPGGYGYGYGYGKDYEADGTPEADKDLGDPPDSGSRS